MLDVEFYRLYNGLWAHDLMPCLCRVFAMIFAIFTKVCRVFCQFLPWFSTVPSHVHSLDFIFIDFSTQAARVQAGRVQAARVQARGFRQRGFRQRVFRQRGLVLFSSSVCIAMRRWRFNVSDVIVYLFCRKKPKHSKAQSTMPTSHDVRDKPWRPL